MAQRYEILATGVSGVPYRIDVYDKDYTGSTVTTLTGKDQFAIVEGGEEERTPEAPVWPSRLRFYVIGDDDLSPLFGKGDRDVRVEATRRDTGNMTFKGYMLTDFFRDDPYSSVPRVELRAVDGLATLGDQTLDDIYSSSTSFAPLSDAIPEILAELYPSPLDVEFGSEWYPSSGGLSSSDCPLKHVGFEPDNYRDDRPSGDWWNLLDVLKDLLREQELTLRQIQPSGEGIIWQVRQRSALESNGDLKVWRFAPDGTERAGYPTTANYAMDLSSEKFDPDHVRDFQRRSYSVSVTHNHTPLKNVVEEQGFEDSGAQWTLQSTQDPVTTAFADHASWGFTPDETQKDVKFFRIDFDRGYDMNNYDNYPLVIRQKIADSLRQLPSNSWIELAASWGMDDFFIWPLFHMTIGGYWLAFQEVQLAFGTSKGDGYVFTEELPAPIPEGAVIDVDTGGDVSTWGTITVKERAEKGATRIRGEISKDIQSTDSIYYAAFQPTSASLEVDTVDTKQDWHTRAFRVATTTTDGTDLTDSAGQVYLRLGAHLLGDGTVTNVGLEFSRLGYDDVQVKYGVGDSVLDRSVTVASAVENGREVGISTRTNDGPTRTNLARLRGQDPSGSSFYPVNWGVGASGGNLTLEELCAREHLRYTRSQLQRMHLTFETRNKAPVLSGHEYVTFDGKTYTVNLVREDPGLGTIHVELLEHVDNGTSSITYQTFSEVVEGGEGEGTGGTAPGGSVAGVQSWQGRDGDVEFQAGDVDSTLAVDTSTDPNTLGIADSGVDTPQLAQDAVTPDKLDESQFYSIDVDQLDGQDGPHYETYVLFEADNSGGWNDPTIEISGRPKGGTPYENTAEQQSFLITGGPNLSTQLTGGGGIQINAISPASHDLSEHTHSSITGDVSQQPAGHIIYTDGTEWADTVDPSGPSADQLPVWDGSTYVFQGINSAQIVNGAVGSNEIDTGAVTDTELANDYTEPGVAETISAAWTFSDGLIVGTNQSTSEEDILLSANANISVADAGGGRSLHFLLNAGGEFRFGFGDTVRSGSESYEVSITPNGAAFGGKTTPSSAVDVSGTVAADDINVYSGGTIDVNDPGTSPNGSAFIVSSANGDPSMILHVGDGTGAVAHRWKVAANTSEFRIRDHDNDRVPFYADAGNSERVGIFETSPSAHLHVGGRGRFQGSTTGYLLHLQNDQASEPAEIFMRASSGDGSKNHRASIKVYSGSNTSDNVGRMVFANPFDESGAVLEINNNGPNEILARGGSLLADDSDQLGGVVASKYPRRDVQESINSKWSFTASINLSPGTHIIWGGGGDNSPQIIDNPGYIGTGDDFVIDAVSNAANGRQLGFRTDREFYWIDQNNNILAKLNAGDGNFGFGGEQNPSRTIDAAGAVRGQTGGQFGDLDVGYGNANVIEHAGAGSLMYIQQSHTGGLRVVTGGGDLVVGADAVPNATLDVRGRGYFSASTTGRMLDIRNKQAGESAEIFLRAASGDGTQYNRGSIRVYSGSNTSNDVGRMVLNVPYDGTGASLEINSQNDEIIARSGTLKADQLGGVAASNYARTDTAETFTSDVNVQGALTDSGNQVWHTGNDGATSTLHAGVFDGFEGPHYETYLRVETPSGGNETTRDFAGRPDGDTAYATADAGDKVLKFNQGSGISITMDTGVITITNTDAANAHALGEHSDANITDASTFSNAGHLVYGTSGEWTNTPDVSTPSTGQFPVWDGSTYTFQIAGSAQIAVDAVGSDEIASGAVGTTQVDGNIARTDIQETFPSGIEVGGTIASSGGSDEFLSFGTASTLSGDQDFTFQLDPDDSRSNRNFYFRIGATNVVHVDDGGDIIADGEVEGYDTSDIRLKDDFTTIDNALDRLCQLRGGAFDWSSKAPDYKPPSGYGVPAQDVRKIAPEMVRKNGSGYLGLQYEQLSAFYIEAIKELKERVEELEAQL